MRRGDASTPAPGRASSWGRSVLASGLFHVLVCGLIGYRFAAGPISIGIGQDSASTADRTAAMQREVEPATADGGLQSETVASSSDSETRSASLESDELPTVMADAAFGDIAVEPGPDFLRQAAQRILAAAQSPAGPEALGQLEKKARVIEEISSPREITRITSQVCRVMGVKDSGDSPNRAADRSARFDYNRCVVSDSQRIESRDRIEIRETLTDRDNGVVVLSYVRATNPTTGAISYSLVQQVAGGPVEQFELTGEEFDEAAERERPYQIINRFSLVKQIHDEAVIPLLRKFSDQSTTPSSRIQSDH